MSPESEPQVPPVLPVSQRQHDGRRLLVVALRNRGSNPLLRSAHSPRMIRPYRGLFNPVQLAWLLPDGETAIHESGNTVRISELDSKAVRVWADFETVIGLLRKGIGESLCWEGAPIRWSPRATKSNWPVRVLRLPAPETTEECIGGLIRWRDWLAEYGASPMGSLGGTAMSLLKARLEKPLYTKVGDRPPIKFPIGGRQAKGPNGIPFQGEGLFRHWDIRAAYSKTLGQLRYGGRWDRIPFSESCFTDSDSGTMYYVRCKLRIPEMPNGPVPVRPRSREELLLSIIHPTTYPSGIDLQGTWTVAEIEAAVEGGATILRVMDVWRHSSGWFPFLPWWHSVEKGRELPGFAALLAKATGNALWGQFAIKPGRRSVLKVADGKRNLRQLPNGSGGNPSQSAPDLAEQVCGRVRANLFRGMTLSGENLITAHTDGLWAYDSTDFDLGGWFSKESASHIRILSPQNLSYIRPGEEETIYVMAGIPSAMSAEWFEKDWSRIGCNR